jgi:hypothetical protein
MFGKSTSTTLCLCLILLALNLSACNKKVPYDIAITPISNPTDINDLHADSNKPFIGFPQPDNYSICLHNTCSEIAFVSLSDVQWKNVENLFYPPSQSAEQERQQLQQAIALLETYTGEQTGTFRDRAENNLSTGIQGQMDCIDEATNTTVYLRMLQNAKLMTWHTQSSRVSRGIWSGEAPHNTATITEKISNQYYAIDSWFNSNGKPPHIVPLDEWKSGWLPTK